jgi:hypothetical protein
VTNERTAAKSCKSNRIHSTLAPDLAAALTSANADAVRSALRVANITLAPNSASLFQQTHQYMSNRTMDTYNVVNDCLLNSSCTTNTSIGTSHNNHLIGEVRPISVWWTSFMMTSI